MILPETWVKPVHAAHEPQVKSTPTSARLGGWQWMHHKSSDGVAPDEIDTEGYGAKAGGGTLFSNSYPAKLNRRSRSKRPAPRALPAPTSCGHGGS